MAISDLRSGRARRHLHAGAMAVLMVAFVGHGTGGASSVSAFVPQRFSLPRRQVMRVTQTTSNRNPRKPPSRQLIMTATPTMGQEEDLLTLPKDDTFSMWGSWRELTYPGNRPTKWVSKTFNDFAAITGGAWRTRVLGLIPSTLLAAPMTNSWIKKAEANNKLTLSWPKSVVALLGEKSIIGEGLTPNQHEGIRDLYLKAIGPSTILNVQPMVESCTNKYIEKMGGFAKTGEVFPIVPVAKELSLDVISTCFLGEIEDGELEGIRKGCKTMSPGMVSIPQTLPWPLSETPLRKVHPLNFGHAMEARKEFASIVRGIVDRRRLEMTSAEKWESNCILDTILEKEAEQRANGAPAEGEMEIDDDFIVDQVVISLFAGQASTTSIVVRLVQMLTAPELKYAAEEILNEVHTAGLKVGSEASGGLFASLPRLQSLVLEIARMYPAVPGVFRKPTEDLIYNGYKIPKGEPMFWSSLPSSMSEEHYPEPERVCPFRFLSNKRGAAVQNTGEPRVAEEPGQPKPPMFGFGKHYCPGRELGRLEIIVFLRKMFEAFDVHLVEGQDLRGNFLENIPLGGLLVKLSKRTQSPVI